MEGETSFGRTFLANLSQCYEKLPFRGAQWRADASCEAAVENRASKWPANVRAKFSAVKASCRCASQRLVCANIVAVPPSRIMYVPRSSMAFTSTPANRQMTWLRPVRAARTPGTNLRSSAVSTSHHSMNGKCVPGGGISGRLDMQARFAAGGRNRPIRDRRTRFSPFGRPGDGQNCKYRLDPSVGAELRYRSVVLSDAWPSVSRMVAAGAPR
jgi:hypothetical protein